ncbi:MAG: hypothetical protein QM398_12625 [Thermoproteota archaeon]|nr:hypothetical protein [Thermoproteota archaeon]
MLKASLQPEIKLTNTEMDVLTSWQAICSDAFNDELYGSAQKHYTEFGRICKCADTPGSKPKWDWKVTSLNECRFIL